MVSDTLSPLEAEELEASAKPSTWPPKFSMAASKLNLVLDVPFNREVADKSALYWTKEKNNLKEILSLAESLSEEDQRTNGIKAITIIKKKYNWNKISGDYKSLFSQ